MASDRLRGFRRLFYDTATRNDFAGTGDFIGLNWIRLLYDFGAGWPCVITGVRVGRQPILLGGGALGYHAHMFAANYLERALGGEGVTGLVVVCLDRFVGKFDEVELLVVDAPFWGWLAADVAVVHRPRKGLV